MSDCKNTKKRIRFKKRSGSDTKLIKTRQRLFRILSLVKTDANEIPGGGRSRLLENHVHKIMTINTKAVPYKIGESPAEPISIVYKLDFSDKIQLSFSNANPVLESPQIRSVRVDLIVNPKPLYAPLILE